MMMIMEWSGRLLSSDDGKDWKIIDDDGVPSLG